MNLSDRKTKIEVLQAIDFGDIDGLYDPNICNYFVDQNYWEQLVDGRKYFVIGRKGTGKSAIYNWIEKQSIGKDVSVSNLSFKNFPFEKLLRLSDDDFSKPNQYQSVWRNIILSEVCKLIIDDPNKDINHPSYNEISRYVMMKFGTELTELHARVTRQTIKNETGLHLQSSSSVTGSQTDIVADDGFDNITQINIRLNKVIKDYLKATNTTRFIIQFDQLDDNYTVYIENNEYFQSILSLFKVIYDIDQSCYRDSIPLKVVGYLRSDIFYEMNKYDAESARWDAHKLWLNWTILNKSDWQNPLLLQMINSRITHSISELLSDENPFYSLFRGIQMPNPYGNKYSNLSVFSYIVRRSFQRPRDILQFVIKIQDECRRKQTLSAQIINDAEKTYSSWLLSEIANEFGPLVRHKDALSSFLRCLGDKDCSYEFFCTRYAEFEQQIGLTPDALLDLLYRLGMINNVNYVKRHVQYYSIFRNEQSIFNKLLRIELNKGILKGLHAFSID